MNEIRVPYHLVIPALVSIAALSLIFLRRRKRFLQHPRLFWISTTLFLLVYFFIVASAAYSDIAAQQAMNNFDLNADGFFSAAEITPEYEAANARLINDTGGNFAFISGLIMVAFVAFIYYIGARMWRFFALRK